MTLYYFVFISVLVTNKKIVLNFVYVVHKVNCDGKSLVFFQIYLKRGLF